jgi:hypothetical protein
MRLVAFCEAADDFRIARDLADRVFAEVGPQWVSDLLEAAADGVRTYRRDGALEYFVVRSLRRYEDDLGVRVPHGHFAGGPGAADATMGRTIFAIVRAMLKTEPVDGVIIVRDLDNDPSRRDGLDQARGEARKWASFAVVLGCANIMREAWVLVGFEPDGDEEKSRLDDLRRELGFAPNLEPHRLDSNDERAKKSPKRVLRALTLGDRDREERCWRESPLDLLRGRCPESGLPAFLDEVAEHLAPLCTKTP